MQTRTLAATILTAIFLSLIISPSAHAQSKEKVLYSFKNDGKDGYSPYAGLVLDSAGNVYGTTLQGGAFSSGCNGAGCGTVFQLAKNPNGRWTETVLYSFAGGADGGAPTSTLVFDSKGNLYGTTQAGGAFAIGTVFELSPAQGGQWTETVVHSFDPKANDGANPYAGVIFDNSGNLFGTTNGGGIGLGTVFELSPGSGGWTESILHAFDTQNYDGLNPEASLTFDKAGNLYSSILKPGHRGGKAYGFVFELTPNGDGTWTEKTLFGCKISGCPNQGSDAHGSIAFDSTGNLYSTMSQGGAYGAGVIFELSPQGKGGKWTETVIHSFKAGYHDGATPQAGLIRDSAGRFYGTTEFGGQWGTVYALTHRKGSWSEKVLHVFGKGKDGADPYAGLVFDAAGNLYGTTSQGGTNDSGTVFEINP